MMHYQFQILSEIIHLRSMLARELSSQAIPTLFSLNNKLNKPVILSPEAAQKKRMVEGEIEAYKNKLIMLDEFRF